jgi:hypothetical protein
MSRGRKLLLLAAAFVLGVGLMVPFEATITRILGMTFLLAFIVGGVFLISEPGFLAADEEDSRTTGGDGET